MQIPVVIEPVAGNGYRVSGNIPFTVAVEGPTPEDAMARFRDCVVSKLPEGARITSLELDTDQHPWAKAAGVFDESDPIVREWLDLIEHNRSRPEDLE
jgi:hypothetical protein